MFFSHLFPFHFLFQKNTKCKQSNISLLYVFILLVVIQIMINFHFYYIFFSSNCSFVDGEVTVCLQYFQSPPTNPRIILFPRPENNLFSLNCKVLRISWSGVRALMIRGPALGARTLPGHSSAARADTEPGSPLLLRCCLAGFL